MDFHGRGDVDPVYRDVREDGIDPVVRELPGILEGREAIRFSDLWPEILERYHITKTDLGRTVWKMRKQGTLKVEGIRPGQRSMKDEHLVSVRGDKT